MIDLKPIHRIFGKTTIWLFVLALVVRLAFFAAFAIHKGTWNFIIPGGDAYDYLQIGKNLVAGNGFSDSPNAPFHPNGNWPPLIPFLVGLLGRGEVVIFLLSQIIVASLSVIILYRLGCRVFGQKVSFCAALLFALDPLSAYYSTTLLSETWFTFLFLLTLLYAVKFSKTPRYLIILLAGVFLGLATLTRVVSFLFPLLIIFMIFLQIKSAWRKKIIASVVLCFAFIIVLTPWLWRNYKVFGSISLASAPAYNWYWYNTRQFYAYQKGISQEEAKKQFRQWKEQAVLNHPQWRNEMLLQPFYLNTSWEIIKPNFVSYAGFHFVNTAAVFLNSGVGDIQTAWTGREIDVNLTAYVLRGWRGITELFQTHPVILLEKTGLVLLYGIMIGGLFLGLGNQLESRYYLFLLLTILYFGLVAGAAAGPRFRVPVEPIILLLFVKSASLLWEKMHFKD